MDETTIEFCCARSRLLHSSHNWLLATVLPCIRCML